MSIIGAALARGLRSGRLLGLAMVGSGAALLAATPQPAAAEGAVLVELYTSQGCYSCPPADALLGELAQRENIAALTLNVDYWDYLGWKDRLAQPGFSERQRAYAYAHRESVVGTPTIIVHGMGGMPGGRRARVESEVATVAAAPQAAQIALVRDARRLEIAITPAADAGASEAAMIMVAPYRAPVAQDIGAGENAGEKIVYHNSVIELRSLGAWNGEAASFAVALPAEARGAAVWIQERAGHGVVGKVLAAAKIEGGEPTAAQNLQ